MVTADDRARRTILYVLLCVWLQLMTEPGSSQMTCMHMEEYDFIRTVSTVKTKFVLIPLKITSRRSTAHENEQK